VVELEFTEIDPPRDVLATKAEIRALRRARHGLHLEELSDDQVRLGPRQGFAGSVLLPTGRRVVVSPKARVGNMPDLLTLAYRTMAPPVNAGSAAVEDATPTEWLLLQLADEVNELLGRGLRRGYVERRERLPFVRGRARPPLNPAELPFHDCQYADFTADTTENQLLRGVLELLAPAARNRAVRRRLADAIAFFGEVTPVRPTVHTFDRVRLTRLNQHYAPSLRLARLALQGAGVVDAANTNTAPAYFVEMWRVWQAAVANALRDAGLARVLEQPEYADRFVQLRGLPWLNVTIKPDIVIGSRTRPRLAIDLKWAPALKLRHGKKRLVNDDLYQLATYCSALGCDGMLVYPLMEDPVDSTYEFNGRRLTIKTVDLGVPALATLRVLATQVADRVSDHS
jgi:5-methylcytosine-specific restriction enzyme subunit McrC